MKRRIVIILALIALMLATFSLPPQAVQAQTNQLLAAPAPRIIAEVNGAGKGRVWVGAVPANSSSKPVLVFVHGLHGKAPNWWGETMYHGTNDMYDKAYAAGYRTAFVSIDDEVDGPSSTIWTNGATLNRQLDVILSHYGVSSVNIIAHSKGGVDTNSAVIHYGASSKVQNIVTLSSPHRGSQLADLANSWWAGWLASLLGQRDDGTYSMQTSYMNNFRAQTDGSANYNNVRFHTAGGTNHGPFFSAMWFGGAYISGDNDGVVQVSSSIHPRQTTRLFTRNYDHDNIRLGSVVWSSIEPSVRSTFRSKAVESASASPVAEQATSIEANSILRGGMLESASRSGIRFKLETGVKTASFDFVSNSADLDVSFVDSQGQRYAANKPALDGEFFRGAYHYSAEVAAPASGTWSVVVSGGKADTAYLFNATLESSLKVQLDAANLLAQPNQNLGFKVNAANAQALSIKAQLTGTPQDTELHSAMPTNRSLAAKGVDRATLNLSSPQAFGLYQLAVTVTGTTADGSSFERSIPLNIGVVDSAAKNAADSLPAGR
ncbi:alpha/beta fold hydrolase [Herpetosiphon geysericola]|uniref:alpha/beta fold hydrolase n=1 Tax=Herpetosiphon geysericola TaxID=70996 RepID=UPI0006C8EB9E|nr:alpha/beta fold hydrolase [Herpetosiphon geysericola]